MCRKMQVILFMVCAVIFTGCQREVQEEQKAELSKEEIAYEELKEIAQIYLDIYEEAYVTDQVRTLETKQKIVKCLGSYGYSVTDTENEINMCNPELVEKFCEKAQNGERAEVTILLVMDNGGFVKYNLQAEDGKIDVVRSSLFWEELKMKTNFYEEFEAYTWSYTEKGYLFLEQYHPSGYDGSPGQVGIRVKPLDESLREWNRKYVIPVGYGCNKMLITDWNETDYSALDFYDLYEIMYRLKYGYSVPDSTGINGVEKEIPAEEFEEVIQSYFLIEVSKLRELTVYNDQNETYLYRPRTMYDMEMPYGPYPEVVAYEKQEDGTFKLKVDAVWTREKLDCAMQSELVVRPLENGKFQYVSNRVLPGGNTVEPTWHQPRLTGEEWEALFSESVDVPIDEETMGQRGWNNNINGRCSM